ncbi:MAG: DUF502 domain-containing protein [Rhodospirillales bacterium]
MLTRNTERKAGFGSRLRGYFLAGILVTAPIGITVMLAWWFIGWVDDRVVHLIPQAYNPESYLPVALQGFGIPGLGLLVVIIVLTLIGMLTAGFAGRFIVRLSERILAQMPVVSKLYSALKQIFETVMAQKSDAFRQAVLIEYPRRGIWAIGFLTGTTEGEVQNLTQERVVNVFLPTTPNPTSGFLLFVPKEDVIPLTMKVEDAIKMVVSGGIVTPPDRRSDAEKSQPKTSAKTFERLDIIREKEISGRLES